MPEKDTALRSEAFEHGVVPHSDHAREASYDVVVIGAGIGGLTAGALLAQAGKKVLVVEAQASAGGFSSAIRAGAYTFDRADHLIMGCEDTGPFGQGVIDAVLRYLGVRDRCRFVRMDDPIYAARFPDLTVSVPHGREAYLEAHLQHFPGEAAALRRLIGVSADIFREVAALPLRLRTSDIVRLPRRFPNLFRYRNATMSGVFDREFTDPRLKQVCGALSTWIGPPAHQASFIAWAAMTASYVEDGAYYCLGSFQALADAIAAGLSSAGGELLLEHRVTRILTKDARVTGIELDDGQRIETSVVVSNIDARQTFETLLRPDEVSPRYLRRLRGMKISPSAVAMYLATDLDVRELGAAHDTTLFTGWDHERGFGTVPAWEARGFSILIPTLKDASLAPDGQHLLILKAFDTSERDLPDASDDLMDRMLELAEQVVPGLRQHLTYVHEAPAVTRSPTRLHLLAPVYGWATTPGQTGLRRLAPEGPIRGVILSGHWTRLGHGVSTVVRSGLGAARLVLGSPTSSPPLPVRL